MMTLEKAIERCIDRCNLEGDGVNLKGTIKDHTEYKDEKQTVLTRCKVSK